MKFLEKMKNRWVVPKFGIENFESAADITYEIVTALSIVIESFCNQKIARLQIHAQKAFEAEIEIRKIYKTFMETKYSRKKLNFSREDRQEIFNQILEITDLAIFIIRRFSVYHPNINHDLLEFLQQRVPSISQSGKLIQRLIHALFHDFRQANNIIWEIHENQLEFWPLEVNFLKEIYESDLSPKYILFFEILLRDLRRILLMVVRFSDIAEQLILKYTF